MDETKTRLAEVISSLSLATDLATGQPLEHGLQRALLAVWLAEEISISEEELSDVYFVALLGTVGCTLESAALSHFFSDEVALSQDISRQDPTKPLKYASFFLSRAGEGEPPLSRARKIVALAAQGSRESQIICRDVALQVGDFLSLEPSVRQAVGQCHEHWNGKGGPLGLAGSEISLAARIFVLAHDIDVFRRFGGVDAAVQVVKARAGRLYDPSLAERFCMSAGKLLSRLESVAPWEAVLEAEPAPWRWLRDDELDELLRTAANFIDARSPFTLGHSPRVAELAQAASTKLRLSDPEASSLRQAGFLHDLGRLAVPVSVWHKEGPLDEIDWQAIKKHPSLTELLVARSSALGQLGTIAGLHHERLDGSGYRRVTAVSLPLSARILAVADSYQTKLESRPHRPALDEGQAVDSLNQLAREGKFEPDVVDAVLASTGKPFKPRKREWPAGLSDREVEVLRLAVTGLSNRQMAEALFISPRTIGHHIQHIYEKCGFSTRVGATLFALQNNLLEGPDA